MFNLRLERTSFFRTNFSRNLIVNIPRPWSTSSGVFTSISFILFGSACILTFFDAIWFLSVRFGSVELQFLAPKCVYCSCKRWPVRFVSDYISERLVSWVNAGAQTFKKPSPLNRTETKTKNHQHIHTKVTQLETFLPYYEGKHDIAMATINVAICDSLMQRHFEIYEKWATEPCDEGNIKAKWKKNSTNQ